MKLKGLERSKVATPFGLVTLNRFGEAPLSQEQAQFIKDRIAAGCLENYILLDETATAEPPPVDKPKK